MANNLSALLQPRRSFGFAGEEGQFFDEMNQPQEMRNLITNQSLGVSGGQMPSRPMGSPVDVFGQGRGYMQPDGTIVGVNEQGQQFAVNPAGTAAAKQAAQDAALKRRMLLAEIGIAEGKTGGQGLSPSDQLAREKFEWEKSQAKTPQDKGQVERVQTATDALSIIDEAKSIFDKGVATESYIGKGVDIAGSLFGVGTKGSADAARLKALGGALVSKMPKMSGPQSDKDVQLYREMAGQIADDTVPLETRRAALQTVEGLQKKYAGIQDTTPAQPAQAGAPRTGDIQDGYIFLGGNPGDPSRWRKK